MERFTIEYEHHGGRQTTTTKCGAILALRTRFEGLKKMLSNERKVEDFHRTRVFVTSKYIE